MATSPATAGSRSRSASCRRVTRIATRIPMASRIPYQRGASGPRWNTNGFDGLGIEASSTPRTYRYRPAMEPGGAAEDSLRGRVAVVAGGTRGAGRGIAVALGARGAMVYVTGRSTAAG